MYVFMQEQNWGGAGEHCLSITVTKFLKVKEKSLHVECRNSETEFKLRTVMRAVIKVPLAVISLVCTI
jgi:hypothetical protein